MLVICFVTFKTETFLNGILYEVGQKTQKRWLIKEKYTICVFNCIVLYIGCHNTIEEHKLHEACIMVYNSHKTTLF